MRRPPPTPDPHTSGQGKATVAGSGQGLAAVTPHCLPRAHAGCCRRIQPPPPLAVTPLPEFVAVTIVITRCRRDRPPPLLPSPPCSSRLGLASPEPAAPAPGCSRLPPLLPERVTAPVCRSEDERRLE
ncbi:Os12g0425100 [Oryza sativa Japonica Group]|uniref:Os12g0425100 protein n=1 Tax=Oryza sativa subsp. japonica TaxID=39947 RepID=A0A0P0Y9G2_ORYSJ|nr:Os12g0425100 [Oryza sativa Japonica Group]